MTQASIECFLAICRHKTVSKAAQKLFITQSSLSIRLKTLEKELGGALFFRKNGSREMILTPAGEKLYQLALQYQDIMEEMQQVCKIQPTVLRVSAINSLGTYFLPEVYERFMQEFPQYRLEIQDMERENAEDSLGTGQTDLAFTSGKTTRTDLIQTPLFSEPMVLICGRDIALDTAVTAEQLSEYKEAYVEWNRPFARWHQEHFADNGPRITLSIMAQLEQFMKKGDYWAILPVSVADGLAQVCELRVTEAAFTLPRREISVLTPARPVGTATEDFFHCLHTVVGAHQNLDSLL